MINGIWTWEYCMFTGIVCKESHSTCCIEHYSILKRFLRKLFRYLPQEITQAIYLCSLVKYDGN